MSKVKHLSYALLLGGIAITAAYSQDTSSEYVAPPDAGPKGKAPKMKVQLLNPGEPTKQYAVIFYQGDEAFSGMLEFAQKLPSLLSQRLLSVRMQCFHRVIPRLLATGYLWQAERLQRVRRKASGDREVCVHLIVRQRIAR